MHTIIIHLCISEGMLFSKQLGKIEKKNKQHKASLSSKQFFLLERKNLFTHRLGSKKHKRSFMMVIDSIRNQKRKLQVLISGGISLPAAAEIYVPNLFFHSWKFSRKKISRCRNISFLKNWCKNIHIFGHFWRLLRANDARSLKTRCSYTILLIILTHLYHYPPVELSSCNFFYRQWCFITCIYFFLKKFFCYYFQLVIHTERNYQVFQNMITYFSSEFSD